MNECPHVGVVINPERADDEVVASLERAGCTVSTRSPDTPDALTDAVRDLVAAGVDQVAAVGGDGTQRTVAAALRDTDVALVVVPGGTVNLLANVVGTGEIADVAPAAIAGQVREIDLAELDDELFVLNASTGLDAAVISRVEEGHKRFGRLGIAAAGVAQWWRADTLRVRVETDGTTWYSGAAHTVLVMNIGNRASSDFELAPDARYDDGRLDVLVFRRHSVIGLGRAIWAAVRGRDMPSVEVSVAQAADVRVTWERSVEVQLDGDGRPPSDTTTYRSLPGALRVVTARPQPDR